MPAQQAEDMLRQLMQQLQSGQFAQNSMSQLQGAGLGASNPANFYSTPGDEAALRQSVLGSVMSRYYGGAQGMQGIGNPNSLNQFGGQRMDPITGGLNQMTPWMQQGFENKQGWKQAGRPQSPTGIQTPSELGPPQQRGNDMQTMPFLGEGGNQNNSAQVQGWGQPQGISQTFNQDYGNQYQENQAPQGYSPNNNFNMGSGGQQQIYGQSGIANSGGGNQMQSGGGNTPNLLGPPNQMGSDKGGLSGGGFQMYGQGTGNVPDFSSPGQQGGADFYSMMGGYNPQIGALQNDYPSMFNGMLNNAMQNTSNNVNINGDVGGSSNGGSGAQGYNPQMSSGGFPGLDPQSKSSLDQITQGQMGAANVDFGKNKQDLLNNLFGRGINASSAATDAGGKLLYGRQEAMNEIQGQGAQREMQARQALLDQQTALIKAGRAGGNGMGGGLTYGAGVGGQQNADFMGNLGVQLRGGAGMGGYSPSANDNMNFMTGKLGGAGNSQIPLTFDQQMELGKLQLSQQQLQQSGQLGFGGLGLQQQLGMGGQGLQEQGLQQQMMQFLMGQGLQRQQGAAGMNQADLSRMTGYLGNQQNTMAGLGGQQAQIEAQRQSMFSQILNGILGGGSALLGAAGNAGGFGALFGGGG